MKNKIISMFKVAVVAAVLTSCNNAAETQKQVDEQNAKIQSAVDEKFAGLQAEADAACTAKVDELAQAKYDAWYATEGKKKGVKAVVKPKPAPEAKKEEPVKDAATGDMAGKITEDKKSGSMADKIKDTTANKKSGSMADQLLKKKPQ